MDLVEILQGIGADLNPQVRKTLQTAIDGGWQLNQPGMTLCLRLNHPTDEMAMPVYVTWVVGTTPKGKVSIKHFSSGTQGLNKLSGADLLEYLQDPTVAYRLPEEDEPEPDEVPPWDNSKTPEENTIAQLGGKIIAQEKPTYADIMARQKAALAQPTPAQSSAARPLRVGKR